MKVKLTRNLSEEEEEEMALTQLGEKKELKEFAPRKKLEYGGLCHTCHSAPTCTFPRDQGVPVNSCEEYDGAPQAAVHIPRPFPEQPTEPQDETGPDKKEPAKLKGLCVNCLKRETCLYPKPEWGVWHCDEYE
jgi:hypothetical protein